MMKQLLIFASIVIMQSACSDSGSSCSNEVGYDETFSIEANQCYSFTDGTEMLVTEIRNEFCPCKSVCGWEGQVIVHLDITVVDGETIKYVYNGAEQVESAELPNEMLISHDPESLEMDDCTENNQNPNINSMNIIVAN